MKRIAIIGECMIELSGTGSGVLKQAYGGDSLNTAVYLARTAGESVAVDYVTALGTDAISEGMLRRWQDEGINTDCVLRDPGHHPGLYLIELDERGERSFMYWRNQSAARYLFRHPDFSAIESHLKTVDMIYLSGISLAILPAADRQLLVDLLRKASRTGVQVAFDSNYRPALWQSREEEARASYAQIFSITDLALVTNDDENALWGDEDEEATLGRLQAAGVKKAVVKMGAKGCCYQDFTTQARTFVATTPVKQVVDTTSAGDSFNAGFLAGVLNGLSPVKCCEQGHLLAGIVIQHKGAIIPASATTDINFNIQPQFTYSPAVAIEEEAL